MRFAKGVRRKHIPGVMNKTEAEYALTPSWGLKGRYVFESFRPRNQPDGEQFEANHLGVMSVWYFD